MKRLAVVMLTLHAFDPACATEELRFRQNGIEVRATYARGSEAPLLIARHLSAPQRSPDGSAVAWAVQNDWRVLAAVDGTLSRVLQVRGEGASMEAISSELDTRQLPRPVSAPPIWLPPSSVVTSDVEFLRPTPSRQWISRCAWTVSSVAAWLRFAARVRGWEVEAAASPSVLTLRRNHERLGVVLLPRERGAEGTVAVLTRWGAS